MVNQSNLKTLNKEIIDDILVRYYNAGYTMPKWINFSLCMLDNGFEVRYYAAQTTVSKYIYVRNPKNGIEVKVRFSNHKPNFQREIHQDSDFYVGIFNRGTITTESVIPKVLERLQI